MLPKQFNIYLTGVGGQGVGLISEIILRAADHAGHPVKGVDTHGLAQRGGIVISQIRIGEKIHAPLIPIGQADLVVALERHEALRALTVALKNGGTLVYYNTVWQPLPVRLDQDGEVSEETLSRACSNRQIKEYKVSVPDLEDPRMQNIAALSVVDQQGIIPGIETGHYKAALTDLMQGTILEQNLSLFAKNNQNVAGTMKRND
jgi:indolepyruvate ferredoxin oxidoreductase beta subunit